jgi:hypothetical protein
MRKGRDAKISTANVALTKNSHVPRDFDEIAVAAQELDLQRQIM